MSGKITAWILAALVAASTAHAEEKNWAEYAPGRSVNLDIPLTGQEVSFCQSIEAKFRSGVLDSAHWAEAERLHGRDRAWCAWLFRVYRVGAPLDLPLAEIIKLLSGKR